MVVKPLNAKQVGEESKRQIAELTQLPPYTVSSIDKDDAGWHVDVEMVELERIPHSQDILATYRVLLDDTGVLMSYARTRRYSRDETSGLHD